MCLTPDQEFFQQLYFQNSYRKKDNTLLLQLDIYVVQIVRLWFCAGSSGSVVKCVLDIVKYLLKVLLLFSFLFSLGQTIHSDTHLLSQEVRRRCDVTFPTVYTKHAITATQSTQLPICNHSH